MPPATCVLYYPMQDDPQSAVVRDRSGAGNNGTIVGASWARTGQGLWYIDCDGTDDYIDTGTAFQSTMRGSFSLNIWAKPDDGQGAAAQCLMGDNNTGTTDRINLEFDTAGKVGCFYESNNVQCRWRSNAANFANGQETWHMVTYTIDSTIQGAGAALVYFDGVAIADDGVDAGDSTGQDSSLWTSADELFIGCYDVNGDPQNDYAGGVALPLIVEEVLTAEYISGLFGFQRHLLGV